MLAKLFRGYELLDREKGHLKYDAKTTYLKCKLSLAVRRNLNLLRLDTGHIAVAIIHFVLDNFILQLYTDMKT